jgi:hypothetical protein
VNDEESAVRAGNAWTMRKIATAARMTRMSDPETTESVEKTRSPTRCLALGLAARASTAMGSRSLDAMVMPLDASGSGYCGCFGCW